VPKQKAPEDAGAFKSSHREEDQYLETTGGPPQLKR
jgi:hypothetical protein